MTYPMERSAVLTTSMNNGTIFFRAKNDISFTNERWNRTMLLRLYISNTHGWCSTSLPRANFIQAFGVGVMSNRFVRLALRNRRTDTFDSGSVSWHSLAQKHCQRRRSNVRIASGMQAGAQCAMFTGRYAYRIDAPMISGCCSVMQRKKSTDTGSWNSKKKWNSD